MNTQRGDCAAQRIAIRAGKAEKRSNASTIACKALNADMDPCGGRPGIVNGTAHHRL